MAEFVCGLASSMKKTVATSLQLSFAAGAENVPRFPCVAVFKYECDCA